MKKISLFVFVLLIIFGCREAKEEVQEKKVKYFYVFYDIDCCTELKLDTIYVDYIKKITDSIYILNYVYSNDSTADTVTHKFKLSDKFKPELLYNGKKRDHDEYLYFTKEYYRIKGKSFDVYKYVLNPGVIDGCINHFWTPEIGVFISRSWTWRNYRKLQTNNDSINEYIDLLTELIYQDIEFFSGCEEELELVPKSDAEKFYNEKIKDIKEIMDIAND